MPINPQFVPVNTPQRNPAADPARGNAELLALIQQLQAQRQQQAPFPQVQPQSPIDGTTGLSAGFGAAGNAIEGFAGAFADRRKRDADQQRQIALVQALQQRGGF